MFQRLTSLVQRLFPGPDHLFTQPYTARPYIQDDPNRRLQLLFFKLLMVLARSDNEVTLEELNLLKDFVFEHSLTEQEWREIQYYGHASLSADELGQLVDTVVSEIRSRADTATFDRAVREIVEADAILGEHEREILDVVRTRLKGIHIPVITYTLKTLRVALRTTPNLPSALTALEQEAGLYVLNPAAAMIRREVGAARDFQVEGAKIGLMMLIIRSDSSFEANELSAFRDFLCHQCDLPREKAGDLVRKVLTIPEEYFELTHLARTLVDNTSVAERTTFLQHALEMTRADNIQTFEEARTFRLIARYLFVDWNDVWKEVG